MRRYILYVGSEEQLQLTRASLSRLGAHPHQDSEVKNDGFQLKHKQLPNLELIIHLHNENSSISAHLQKNPIDLMIYDERKGFEAIQALHKIRDDILNLSRLWGPDFQLPMGRILAILEDTPDSAHRSFVLGRDHVRDVIAGPKSMTPILLWIARIFQNDLKPEENKVGLALSGGGVEGFLFQVGCLYALSQSLKERSITHQIDFSSGMSAGSILTTLLGAGLPIEEVVKSIRGQPSLLPPLRGKDLYDIAGKNIAKHVFKNTFGRQSLQLSQWPNKAFQSIPTGLFEGNVIRKYIQQTLQKLGCEDSFHLLKNPCFVGATDHDTFEHTVFGLDPWMDVPVSEAVRASCAIPPFFTPVSLGGRFFIDGQITKTCNLELLVRQGCRLILIVDPVQPYTHIEAGTTERQGGGFSLIQTIKTLIYTRFQQTLIHLTERYPDVDFVVFQPWEECAELMSGSPMKYRLQQKLVDFAYQGTLRRLRERHHVYHEKFSKYSFSLIDQQSLLETERKGILL
ncbi:MAG: patatin-like phospholipase family protein [Oligoflexales bacterium]